MKRMVYIPDDNIMGEIVSEQVHGAYIKYTMGGFEHIELMSKDDYEEMTYFDYYEDEEDE